MKLLLLTVYCVITVSLSEPFSAKEANLEAALRDIEVLLQDMHENEAPADPDDLFENSESFADDMRNKNEADPDDLFKSFAGTEDFFGDLPMYEKLFTDADEFLGDLPNPRFHPTPDTLKASSLTMEEVLLYTENTEKATAEIKAAGGRVKIQLGHDLLIADIPAHIATTQNFAHSSTHIPNSVPQKTQSNAQVYRMYREDLLKPQPMVQKWTDKSAPKGFPREDPYPSDSPYALTMHGKIAVIVVVASGEGTLAMSDAEYNLVCREVINGLTAWTSHAPANADLSFVVYPGRAFITVADGLPACTGAGCHNVFANAALAYFGYNSKDDLAKDGKRWAGRDAAGAYIGYFSKYRQSHFAYAYFGGGPIYMQYSNDGWGPEQIDRVFAHESGHVFNAPDEYTGCNCQRGYGRGACTETNDNCETCTQAQEACIMDSNDINNICAHTLMHVGWC